MSSKNLGYLTRYCFACISLHAQFPQMSWPDGSKGEVVTMTSCQRPKGCEPSRYRHGNDPPKQVETASLSNSRRTLSLSSTQSSFDPFTYIRSKVTESEASSMSSPTITVVVPVPR